MTPSPVAVIILACLCGLLTLAPAAILKKDRLNVSIVLTLFAILSVGKFGGLLFAAPATLVLLLYFLWVRFVGHAVAGPKRALFITTLVLAALYLVVQIVHLPIRFALSQPAIMITANVAGILMALAMLSAAVELIVVLETQRSARPAEAEDSPWVDEEPDIFAKPRPDKHNPDPQ